MKKSKLILAASNLLVVSSIVGGFLGCSVEPLEDEFAEELGETELALVRAGVRFRTTTTSSYLGATNNGGSTVTASATTAQTWETFSVDDINGGTLNSGDSVFIQAGNGQYWKAQDGGGTTLAVNSANRQGWETFKIVKKSGSGAVVNGDVVGIQSSTGTWVRAVNGGGGVVDVRGASLGGWEGFTISGLATQNTNADPTCATGIKNGDACCPAACGSCGGSGCGSRPGGTAACCTGPILTAAVSCSGAKPPCVVSSSNSGTGGTSGGTGGSSSGTGGSSGSNLVWRTATLTNYESYPDPGSDECIEFNGCTWAGQFAALSGQQPESWVMANNIAAVHSKDFAKYKLKTLRLKQGTKQIDVKVYDMCADSDCDGCCTQNAQPSGNLIDVEKYTMQRFGTGSGQVQWACLDCGSNP